MARFQVRNRAATEWSGQHLRFGTPGLRVMRGQQIEHVVRVFFLIRQNAFHHHARSGISIAEIAHQFPVMLAGNPLRNKVFFNHLHQISGF